MSRKICYVKSGLQILYAVEQFSPLFSKDKLKARATHTPTHDPPSHICCVDLHFALFALHSPRAVVGSL